MLSLRDPSTKAQMQSTICHTLIVAKSIDKFRQIQCAIKAVSGLHMSTSEKLSLCLWNLGIYARGQAQAYAQKK
jgi:hypothetical protein